MQFLLNLPTVTPSLLTKKVVPCASMLSILSDCALGLLGRLGPCLQIQSYVRARPCRAEPRDAHTLHSEHYVLHPCSFYILHVFQCRPTAQLRNRRWSLLSFVNYVTLCGPSRKKDDKLMIAQCKKKLQTWHVKTHDFRRKRPCYKMGFYSQDHSVRQ